ncbi:hypothetical protein DM01DRAFT_1135022 [Hesseltinella vesiculosa]|uniref:Uncharacterized protein n=1 Tax=Hesseltinella vesiculosa TaxID=101127 RepID=A0A1X2GA20_9FUNG|nr:hypothetical protein DM01DRAFT_1135022 [Hesseltinella vesiculosa]
MAIHPSTSSTTAPPVASSSPAPSHRSSASTPPLTAEAQPAKSQPAETQSADHTLSSDPSLPATPSQLEHRPVQDGPTGH